MTARTVRLSRVVENSQFLAPDPARLRDLYAVCGRSASATWQPLPVTLVTHEGRRRRTPADVFDSDPVLTMTRSAWERLEPIVGPYGELLDLTCPDLDVIAFNVTVTVDALDEERADLLRLRNGSVLVNAWAFHPTALPADGLFHIAQRAAGFHVLATGSVADALAATDLAGIRWPVVWDSETGAVP